MKKKMFMFWDKAEKVITDSTDRGPTLGFYPCFGDIKAWSGDEVLTKRYTLLRCAIHAPELKDESTDEVRQLCEGDVVITEDTKRNPSVIIFSKDALHQFYKTEHGECELQPNKHWIIKGNALLAPSLVADWDNLPDWTLLQERVSEWKAAQTDPKLDAIKKDVAGAQQKLESAQARLENYEVK